MTLVLDFSTSRSHIEKQNRNQDDYEVIEKIGRGKYSEVFYGRNRSNNQSCVIKILKPVRNSKIKREIKVLQNLHGGPNVITLHDIVQDQHTKIPSLIFEWVDNTHFRDLYPKLSDEEIRFYMYELLKALDFSHSHGIMHRDVKPHNVMIDHSKKRLRLIDWGLAEFYVPGQSYNVRVASRYYKSPSLLVNNREYHYALDLWSFGCILAGIVFDREPMFKGRDNTYQLIKIAKVLGTKPLYTYLDKYDLDLDIKFDGLLGDFETRPWKDFVSPRRKDLAKPEALDLIDRLLVYDHHDRLTAREAMNHSYFSKVSSSTLKKKNMTQEKKSTTVSSMMDDLKAKLNL